MKGVVIGTAASRPGTAPASAPDGQPAPASPSGRTWAISTTSGCSATGYLPAWAESDPSETGVPLERLGVKLADLCHRAPFGGQALRVSCGGGAGEESEVFWGAIECTPYAEDPGPRIPVANVWLVDDYWIHNLDPDGVEDLAVRLRAQADRLDHEIRPALIAARADWTTHRGS